MKKGFVILGLLMLLLPVFGGEAPMTVVYVNGLTDELNSVMAQTLASSLTKEGKYYAIDRSKEFRQALYDVHGDSVRSLYNEEAVRIAQKFDAEVICAAEVTKVQGEQYLSFRMIDVETGEQFNTFNTKTQLDDAKFVATATEELARMLSLNSSSDFEQQKVIMEKKLALTFERGYYKIGTLYVTTANYYGTWSVILAKLKETNTGGYTDWRLPTISEVAMAKSWWKDTHFQYGYVRPLIERLPYSVSDWWAQDAVVTNGVRNMVVPDKKYDSKKYQYRAFFVREFKTK